MQFNSTFDGKFAQHKQRRSADSSESRPFEVLHTHQLFVDWYPILLVRMTSMMEEFWVPLNFLLFIQTYDIPFLLYSRTSIWIHPHLSCITLLLHVITFERGPLLFIYVVFSTENDEIPSIQNPSLIFPMIPTDVSHITNKFLLIRRFLPRYHIFSGLFVDRKS